MILYYKGFGLLANFAMVLNLVFILAFLSNPWINATLSLPGIAGIILTVGMAVDANVLIFERIKEEMRNEENQIYAYEAGYRKAQSAVLDANITTLISAIILFMMGSGPIKGFAVTLAIGILTSMFTSIMLTRFLIVLWLRGKRPNSVPI